MVEGGNQPGEESANLQVAKIKSEELRSLGRQVTRVVAPGYNLLSAGGGFSLALGLATRNWAEIAGGAASVTAGAWGIHRIARGVRRGLESEARIMDQQASE